MKKVLQVSKQMYPFIGGIEQVARDIANALPKDEYEQKIICFNEDAEDGKYVCRRKETVKDTVDGVEVIRCGCIAKVASQSISFSYPRQLKKVFEDFNPDIVVFHYPNPYVATFLMKRIKENMKFILYWHLDITKQRMLGRLFHSQSVKLLRRADAVVAASPNYIEGSPYLAMYKDKCTVIPNCVDLSRLTVTEEIKKNSDDLRSSMDGKTICFACGRHVPYKGYTYLVKASKLLPDSFSICIGGKGELTDQLKKEAEGDDKIQFLGRLSDEELLTYLLACDIFCFPSITKNEAYGIALAEAMYFGKPAVTFTIPGSGVNFVSLDGVTGIECPNRDEKAYAAALQKLAEDSGLREKLGQNARQRALDNFTQEKFDSSICNLMKM